MARAKDELTKEQRALKNREYEAFKNSAIAYVQSLDASERKVIFDMVTYITSLELKDATYYDTGTFYHVMDACKEVYYSGRKVDHVSPVAIVAPKSAKAVLTVQPTPTGNIVTVASDTVDIPKASRKATKATNDNDVMSLLTQIARDNADIKARLTAIEVGTDEDILKGTADL